MPKYIRDRSKLAERLRLLREGASYPGAPRPFIKASDKHQGKNSSGNESAKISADDNDTHA